MDDLVYLNLLENLENAVVDPLEANADVPRYTARDPLIELSNEQFRKIFRLTKDLFRYLVELLRPYIQVGMTTVCLNLELKILIGLKFYATGSYQSDVGHNWFLGVSQSSVSRCVTEVTEALNQRAVMDQFIRFPRNFRELNRVRLSFYEKYNFPGIIGCIDCTHVAIFPPNVNDPNHPEHLYVNRKGYHSINVQLVCDADLRILNVNALYPGSTNDAFIWGNSNVQRLLRELHAAGHKDYFLLGDSGYPLRTWLLTPIDGEVAPNTPEHEYNMVHKSIRSLIERCNGVLKMRFRCLLKHRVLHYAPETACRIINACVIMHNLCIEHNVPEPDADINEPNVDWGMGINDERLHENAIADAAARRVNPELVDGRTVRRRLINSLFI